MSDKAAERIRAWINVRIEDYSRYLPVQRSSTKSCYKEALLYASGSSTRSRCCELRWSLYASSCAWLPLSHLPVLRSPMPLLPRQQTRLRLRLPRLLSKLRPRLPTRPLPQPRPVPPTRLPRPRRLPPATTLPARRSMGRFPSTVRCSWTLTATPSFCVA